MSGTTKISWNKSARQNAVRITLCVMSKKRNRKRAVATQDKENSLNEKRKRRLEGKSRESEKADGRPSGSAGDSASLSFSARLALLTACACLRRGAAEPHLS